MSTIEYNGLIVTTVELKTEKDGVTITSPKDNDGKTVYFTENRYDYFLISYIHVSYTIYFPYIYCRRYRSIVLLPAKTVQKHSS